MKEIFNKYDKPTLFLGLYCLTVMVTFFFLPTSPHRNVLYVGGVLSIFIIFLNKKLFADFFSVIKSKSFFKHPLFISAVLFLFYNMMSVIWSDPDTSERIFKNVKIPIILSLFLFVFMAALSKNKNLFSWMLGVFIAGNALMSAYLIIDHFIIDGNTALRLRGIGRAVNPISLGLLSGISALLLVFNVNELPRYFENKWVRVGCFLLVFATFIASFSRGPLLAFIMSCCVLLVLKKKYKTIIGIIAFAVSFILIEYFFDITKTNFFERGTSGRFEVWAAGFQHILEKPIFGHGVATKFHYDITYMGNASSTVHMHSVYFSHLLQGGIIGLGFLLSTYFLLYKSAFRNRKENLAVFSFALMGSFLGLTDFGGFHVNMNQVWLVFWIPIAYLVFTDAKRVSSQR